MCLSPHQHELGQLTFVLGLASSAAVKIAGHRFSVVVHLCHDGEHQKHTKERGSKFRGTIPVRHILLFVLISCNWKIKKPQ